MKTLILLLITTSLSAQLKLTDKDYHFMASATIACTSSIIAYKITDRPVLSCLVGLALSVGVGFAKERFYDGMLNRGHEDYKGDFPADIKGAITGSYIAGGCILLKKHHERKIEIEKFEALNVPNPLKN